MWDVPYPLLDPLDGERAERNEERLLEVAWQARSLMDEHGLASWTFRFSAAERRLGECREREKVIRLSRRHAVHGDPREVRDTILHEIAHALAGAEGPARPRVEGGRKAVGGDAEGPRGGERGRPPRAARRRRHGSGRAWR